MGQFQYQPSYRRNLPHIQPPGATFFVTPRLSGSLPKAVVEQWNQERKWLAHLAETNPTHYEQVRWDFERRWFAKFESILDGGKCGPLWLSEERVAEQVAESLHYRDGKVYRLDSFSIMPNHLHVVFKPLPIEQPSRSLVDERLGREIRYHSLAKIMQSLKGYTSYKANRLLHRSGEFWAHESYDHYVRDFEEWQRIMAYVLNNPVKAGYVANWREWKWNYRRS
jgi:putative transposase